MATTLAAANLHRQVSGLFAGPSRLSAPRVGSGARSHRAELRANSVAFLPHAVEDAVRGGSALDTAASPSAPRTGPSSWVAGVVHRIGSPEELKEFLRAYEDTLVCMMCKAQGCRPCKAFERKYKACADDYRDVVFLEIYGDDTVETRKLMIALQVKSTPTFMMFRQKSPVHTHSGISESKLRNVLNELTGRDEVVSSEAEA